MSILSRPGTRLIRSSGDTMPRRPARQQVLVAIGGQSQGRRPANGPLPVGHPPQKGQLFIDNLTEEVGFRDGPLECGIDAGMVLHPDRVVHIGAQGGKSAEQWINEGHAANQVAAIAQLNRPVGAYVFVHGEADSSSTLAVAQAYYAFLESERARVRAAWGPIPFIGVLLWSTQGTHYQVIRDALLALGAAYPDVRVVDPTHLVDPATDDLHWRTAAVGAEVGRLVSLEAESEGVWAPIPETQTPFWPVT